MIRTFNTAESEADYRRWLVEHPNGYVVNHREAGKPVLHTSSCPSISRESPPGGKVITTSLKRCGDDVEELKAAEPISPTACGNCMSLKRL